MSYVIVKKTIHDKIRAYTLFLFTFSHSRNSKEGKKGFTVKALLISIFYLTSEATALRAFRITVATRASDNTNRVVWTETKR